MPISSIRLSESVRRAVKASDQSISELAREGIEQAIVGDYVSICWICGEAIHRDERRDYISTEVFIDDIANRDVDRSYQSRDYQTSVENIREYEQHNPLASDYYFERVLDWLNLPEPGFYPVEICGSCSEYIDKIRNQTIQASDIPIPYQYRTEEEMDHHPHLPLTPICTRTVIPVMPVGSELSTMVLKKNLRTVRSAWLVIVHVITNLNVAGFIRI